MLDLLWLEISKHSGVLVMFFHSLFFFSDEKDMNVKLVNQILFPSVFLQ